MVSGEKVEPARSSVIRWIEIRVDGSPDGHTEEVAIQVPAGAGTHDTAT